MSEELQEESSIEEESIEDDDNEVQQIDDDIPDIQKEADSVGKLEEPIKTTDIILIAGKRGSGKTNLTLFLIKQLTNMGVNLIIIDPVHDLKENLPSNDPRIIHIDWEDTKKFNSLIYTLMVKEWHGMIIVDEADKFYQNRKTLTPLQSRFIHIGRHYGIGMIAVSRRLSNLHTDLATQASKLFMFKHWNRNDIQYLRDSSLGEYAALLIGLEKYHFLYLNPDVDKAQICTPVPLQK